MTKLGEPSPYGSYEVAVVRNVALRLALLATTTKTTQAAEMFARLSMRAARLSLSSEGDRKPSTPPIVLLPKDIEEAVPAIEDALSTLGEVTGAGTATFRAALPSGQEQDRARADAGPGRGLPRQHRPQPQIRLPARVGARLQLVRGALGGDRQLPGDRPQRPQLQRTPEEHPLRALGSGLRRGPGGRRTSTWRARSSTHSTPMSRSPRQPPSTSAWRSPTRAWGFRRWCSRWRPTSYGAPQGDPRTRGAEEADRGCARAEGEGADRGGRRASGEARRSALDRAGDGLGAAGQRRAVLSCPSPHVVRQQEASDEITVESEAGGWGQHEPVVATAIAKALDESSTTRSATAPKTRTGPTSSWSTRSGRAGPRRPYRAHGNRRRLTAEEAINVYRPARPAAAGPGQRAGPRRRPPRRLSGRSADPPRGDVHLTYEAVHRARVVLAVPAPDNEEEDGR